MLDVVFGLVGGLFGGSLSDKLTERRARRLQSQCQTECALRVLQGHHPGLSTKWGRGMATLSPGTIDMGWAHVELVGHDLSSVRSPAAKESWSINPGMRLVRIESATAVLEWAVLEKQFGWATGVVFE